MKTLKGVFIVIFYDKGENKMKNYDDLAKFIIQHVGGVENVVSLTHCITRLRFKLKDEKKADKKALEANDGVASVVIKGGQYQVVIGNHVEDVYDAVLAVSGLNGGAAVSDSEEKSGESLVSRFIGTVSGIFMPVLGLLTACGIIKGLSIFLAMLGVFSMQSGTFQILNAIGDTMFYFFPVFLGCTAAEKFGLNKFVGMAVGAALLHPTIVSLKGAETLFTLFQGTMFQSNITTTFMSIPVILMTYSSSVLPVIGATYVGSKIEKVCKKIIPDVVKMFLVPAITLVVTVVLTLLIIGPVLTWASQLLGTAVMGLREISPVLTGAVIGGCWQLFVMLGVHQGIAPIAMNNLMTYGYENVMCAMVVVPFTTLAVVLGVYFKTKNNKLKKIALPAAVSSFFGVSEPSIYGVTLPLKRPFIITLVSGAIGGAILGFFDATTYTQGGLGIFALPAYINPNAEGLTMQFYGVLIGIAVAMTCGFVFTYLFGLPKENKLEEEVIENTAEDVNVMIKQETFTLPVNGSIVELSSVNDEVFASGSIGKGIAILPSDNKIVAPCDGVINMLFPTGHAVGIVSDKNAELLIHIGIDTVQMEGRGFTKKVKQGDRVKKGDVLIEFDKQIIEKEGYDATVMFVVTNSSSFLDVINIKKEAATITDECLAVVI